MYFAIYGNHSINKVIQRSECTQNFNTNTKAGTDHPGR